MKEPVSYLANEFLTSLSSRIKNNCYPYKHVEKRLNQICIKLKWIRICLEREYIFEEDDIPNHLQVDANVEGGLQTAKLTPTSEGQKQNHVCFSKFPLCVDEM